MIALVTSEDRLAAAGEYVLGTLDDADRDAFAAAMAGDPALQVEVYAWQDRLLSLSLRVEPALPSPQLWRRVEGSLNARPSALPRVARPAAVVQVPWWQWLVAWQGLSAVAVAACLSLAVVLLQRGAVTETGAPRYLAVLQSPDERSNGWIVEIVANRSLRLVPVTAAAAIPAGRALQFWTKPQGAASPTSLGLVRPGQLLELPVSSLPAVGDQQLFELTLEPETGSPTGRPTGPILFVGRTVRL